MRQRKYDDSSEDIFSNAACRDTHRVIKRSWKFSFTCTQTFPSATFGRPVTLHACSQAEKHELLVMAAGQDLMLKEMGLCESNHLQVVHETIYGWVYPHVSNEFVVALRTVRSTRWKKAFFLPISKSSGKYCSCWPSYRSCQQNRCFSCNVSCITVLTHFPHRPHNDLMRGEGGWCIRVRRYTSCLSFQQTALVPPFFNIFGPKFSGMPFLLRRTVPQLFIFLLYRCENSWGDEN
jgi:hypothetical protein